MDSVALVFGYVVAYALVIAGIAGLIFAAATLRIGLWLAHVFASLGTGALLFGVGHWIEPNPNDPNSPLFTTIVGAVSLLISSMLYGVMIQKRSPEHSSN
jgi:predicted nuclease of restriction endonuclease-like RecB superfamily